ncbi:protein BOBBER 1-like [Abeliophyllum distichum]|uniref:Protein BOBBER 1-like n=1 Tax=Abeliophyllum distichum TaxID=126358 RepID=A0ABD1RD78_9LAMI
MAAVDDSTSSPMCNLEVLDSLVEDWSLSSLNTFLALLRITREGFESVAKESDLFKSDSLVKDKVEVEEKKRTKELKDKENGQAEKKVNEEPPMAATMQKDEVKPTMEKKKVKEESETKFHTTKLSPYK